MQTNKFFDLDRFFGLFRQDLLINYKFYLYWISGFSISFYVISYLMIRNFKVDPDYQFDYLVLYNLLYLVLAIFITLSFPALRNQVSPFHYFLNPGSTFEKFMVQFVVRFVLFIPLVLVLLKIAVYMAIATMFPDPKTGFDPLFVPGFNYSKLFASKVASNLNPFRDFSYLFVAFACSVYFKRNVIIKTIGVVVLLSIGLFTFVILSSGGLIHENFGAEFTRRYLLYANISPYINSLLFLSLPWAYFKLKEKEL
jgi:hypothetical protein